MKSAKQILLEKIFSLHNINNIELSNKTIVENGQTKTVYLMTIYEPSYSLRTPLDRHEFILSCNEYLSLVDTAMKEPNFYKNKKGA